MKDIIFLRLGGGGFFEVCQLLGKPSAKFVHSNLYLWTERSLSLRKALFKGVNYV